MKATHKNKDAPRYTKKYLNFEMTEATVTKDAADTLTIQGYANTSTKDRVGDVVLPSAFEKSLPTYMNNPMLLANHDWEDPVGSVVHAEITDKGLFVKAMISSTRPDIKTLIREKCLRTFSIGYNELDADFDESTKTKIVKELELLEISIVTIPANAEAMFTVEDVKAEAPAKSEAAPKEEPAPEKGVFVSRMKEFVGKIEKTLVRKLNGSEVGAVCGYFIEHKGDEMKTKELIEKLLATKSAVAAPIAEAKTDGAAPAESQPAGEAQDPMKALEAKLDVIAQALAKVLAKMEEDVAEDSTEDAAPEAAAPAADAAAPAKDAESEEKPADEKAPEAKPAEDEEEMSDEECAKHIAELDAAIAELEAQKDALN